MKIKKIVALALCAVTAFTCVSTAACNNKPEQDGKTVNVMMQLSGWGTDYIKDIAEKFEETYAEEGYKINFLEPRSTFNGSAALSEMRLDYDENGFDIVITGGVTIAQGLDEEYGACITDIDDVYNNGAINFDGTIESTPIKEKLTKTRQEKLMSGDHYYTFGFTDSIRGLVYNEKALKSYGIENPPVTTDELFKQYDIILKGANGTKGMEPTTWGGGNAYGYALGTLYAGLAQLMGVEEYDKFFRLNYLLDENGKIKADGYKLYEDFGPEFQAVLEVLIHKFDELYSYDGAKSQNHTDAHAQLVMGNTVFMQDGEYFYNEVQYDFPDYLEDFRMATTPIVSYLGVMLDLCGVDHQDAVGQITHCDNCDAILKTMCELFDAGKTNEEILAETKAKHATANIDETKVARVVEARSTTHADTGGGTYIMKQSPVQDISKLFLRMLSSKDAAKTVAKYGMMHAFYEVDASEYKSQFTKDCSAINSRIKYKTTSALIAGTVRANTNMFLIPPYNAMLPVTIANEIGADGKVEDRDYVTLSKTMLDKVQKNTKDNWKSLIEQGGYYLGE